MKIFFALLVNIAIKTSTVWFYSTKQGKSTVHTTNDQIESSTKSARDVVQEKLKMLDLRSNDIKDDLTRTNQVVRRKAREISHAISDNTADTHITNTIKNKLITNHNLSTINISINTTNDMVTLSNSISS